MARGGARISFWASLRAQGRELHFEPTRKPAAVIQVRDLDGRVLGTVAPSEALSIASERRSRSSGPLGLPRSRGRGDRDSRRHDPLGQLLQLSAVAGSGSEARALLLEQGVTVNGEPETRRGRQLHRGDVVAVGDTAVRVI